MRLADRSSLLGLLDRVDRDLREAGLTDAHVGLVGETSLLYEGWSEWADVLQINCEDESDDAGPVRSRLRERAKELGLPLATEHPAETFPLPDGYGERARPIETEHSVLRLHHFDPCAASFMAIARGAEPDYHLVLRFLEKGWMTVSSMDRRLRDLLLRIEAEGGAVDAAEMRRRFGGLLQMWRMIDSGTVHRTTPT
ncbi:MAG: hypothetical protein ACE5HF_04780 [Gemmatimonadota bacterium]